MPQQQLIFWNIKHQYLLLIFYLAVAFDKTPVIISNNVKITAHKDDPRSPISRNLKEKHSISGYEYGSKTLLKYLNKKQEEM